MYVFTSQCMRKTKNKIFDSLALQQQPLDFLLPTTTTTKQKTKNLKKTLPFSPPPHLAYLSIFVLKWTVKTKRFVVKWVVQTIKTDATYYFFAIWAHSPPVPPSDQLLQSMCSATVFHLLM